MAKCYDYVLAVWLRLKIVGEAPELADKLQEHLEAEYQVNKLEIVAESEIDTEDETTISLQLQVTFGESRMDADGPTEEALEDLDRELRIYLESKYRVAYVEILDDALTSYLLAEREDE